MEDETKVLSDDGQGSSDQDKAPTTQPILKQLLEEVRGGFARLEARSDTIESDLRDVKDHLRKIDRRLGVLSDDINQLRADSADYENRLKSLEDRKAS